MFLTSGRTSAASTEKFYELKYWNRKVMSNKEFVRMEQI